MAIKITNTQSATVQRLLKCCCNWDKGFCILLDEPCPQRTSRKPICRFDNFLGEAMWLPAFAPASTGIWSSLRGTGFVAPKQYKKVSVFSGVKKEPHFRK